jgi:uncharacterized damage-inducible protein DinB
VTTDTGESTASRPKDNPGTTGSAAPGAVARLIAELERESVSTRRVLERVPEDKLSWKPHPKSMSLGQLAQHIASLSGALAEIISNATWETRDVPRPQPRSVEEIVSAHTASVTTLTAKLEEWGDEGLNQEWRLVRGELTLLSLRRGDLVRFVILNHLYHHRGQLTVYLRMLDVPLPAVYGDSADERPLG